MGLIEKGGRIQKQPKRPIPLAQESQRHTKIRKRPIDFAYSLDHNKASYGTLVDDSANWAACQDRSNVVQIRLEHLTPLVRVARWNKCDGPVCVV